MFDNYQTEGWLASGQVRRWLFAGVVIWVFVGAGLLVQNTQTLLSLVIGDLTSFMFAGVIVLLVRPWRNWLRRHKLGPAAAAAIATLTAVLVIGLLAVAFLGPIISGAIGVVSAAPEAAANVTAAVQANVGKYQALPSGAKSAIQSSLGNVANAAADLTKATIGIFAAGVAGLFSLGLGLFLGLILTFWFLKDGEHIAGAMLGVVPHRWRTDVKEIASAFDRSFSGYLIATAINVTLIFLMDGIMFQIIGLPNGWFIAAMVGMVGVIPFVGSILSFFIAIVVGFAVSPIVGVEVGVTVFVVDQIVYSVLGPIVASKSVNIHPVAVILALGIGASLAGFIGAILGLPVAAAIHTVYVYYRDRDTFPAPPQEPTTRLGQAAEALSTPED